MPNISILIPVLNEAESLEILLQQIQSIHWATPDDKPVSVEVIFIDDGSRDQSWDVMRHLACNHSRVHAIRFRKNFGKAAAMQAGIERSQGDLIVTIDADLQDDPAEIPQLLKKLNEGYDLVSGWKTNRQDPLSKRLPSWVFNRLVSQLTGVQLHDHNCGLKIYRREVFDEIRLYAELHRFVPVLAASRGFRIAELPVNHRARKFGQSKYGSKRLIKGLLDLLTVSFLTGYVQRPQHLLGTLGLVAGGLGSAGMAWMACYWLMRICWYPDWPPLHQRPLLLYSLGSLLLGVQLLTSGFLAELIVAKNQNDSSSYSIRETTKELANRNNP